MTRMLWRCCDPKTAPATLGTTPLPPPSPPFWEARLPHCLPKIKICCFLFFSQKAESHNPEVSGRQMSEVLKILWVENKIWGIFLSLLQCETVFRNSIRIHLKNSTYRVGSSLHYVTFKSKKMHFCCNTYFPVGRMDS